MSNFDGITLRFSEATKSKIAAYAVLSRQNVDTVIGQLEGLIDEALKDKCIELLGGQPVEVPAYGPTEPPDLIVQPPEKVRPHKPKSFADVHKQAAAPPPIETQEEAFGSIEGNARVPQHELSEDEDTQNNKSLEELAEGEELDPDAAEEFQAVFQNAKFKNAGNNAELFLDTAMGSPEDRDDDEIPTVTRGYAGQGPYGERPVKATKTFESRFRKGIGARISPHTGDED